MDKRIIEISREQSITNIYDENVGIIEEDERPDFEEELIVEYREDGRKQKE